MKTKINLNRANENELQQIIHVGKIRALKLINRRPYKDIYELSNVKGLGKSRMNDILAQGLITV